jgi:hypothetical protein
MQVDSVDESLRNALWNIVKLFYWDSVVSNNDPLYPVCYLSSYGNEAINTLCMRLWHNFYKLTLDELPNSWKSVHALIREKYFQFDWYQVYDFIEFLAGNHPDKKLNDRFISAVNEVLEAEVSGCRFVDGNIMQITSTEEIEAIETAISHERGPVQEHLDAAVRLISDRRAPDYRNSVKESISAVEALVKSVCNSDKGTLGDLLKELQRKHSIHAALAGAFSKLYGYTSDANGVRHALMAEDSVSFEEAKFMLVACSAFVNYVRGNLKT